MEGDGCGDTRTLRTALAAATADLARASGELSLTERALSDRNFQTQVLTAFGRKCSTDEYALLECRRGVDDISDHMLARRRLTAASASTSGGGVGVPGPEWERVPSGWDASKSTRHPNGTGSPQPGDATILLSTAGLAARLEARLGERWEELRSASADATSVGSGGAGGGGEEWWDATAELMGETGEGEGEGGGSDAGMGAIGGVARGADPATLMAVLAAVRPATNRSPRQPTRFEPLFLRQTTSCGKQYLPGPTRRRRRALRGKWPAKKVTIAAGVAGAAAAGAEGVAGVAGVEGVEGGAGFWTSPRWWGSAWRGSRRSTRCGRWRRRRPAPPPCPSTPRRRSP